MTVGIPGMRKLLDTVLCVCCFVFIKPIFGNRYGPGDMHLNYVTGYTSSLLFLFERTHNHDYSVDNQGLVPWWLPRLGRSKVCLASLMRVLSNGKICWARGPKVCVILHLPQLET